MRTRAVTVALLMLSLPAQAQEFFTLKGHGGPIMDIAVAPSGTIATASFDYSVGTWNGAEPSWHEGHRAAANAVAWLDDQHLLSAGDDFAAILWDLVTGTSQRFEGHQGKITDIAIAPGGETFATASWDGTIGLWPTAGGEGTFLKGHQQGVNAIAFGDGGRLLYSASSDGTIRLWDVATGQELRQIVQHGFGVNRLILDEDGGRIAYGAVDGVTRIVDPEGKEIADYTLERRPILAMAYHAPSSLLAVGDGEGYIMVIDLNAKRIVRDFRATARGPIWALAFSPDGQNIHAGGLDDVMYSWPVDTLDSVEKMAAGTRSFLRDPETMDNGERQFMRKCSICHTLTEDSARRAGPTLRGVFGRRAGSVPGYSYSATLRNSDIVWSPESINALFDEGPDHYIPGSKMPMQRIAEAVDRRDLIDYLRKATQSGDTE